MMNISVMIMATCLALVINHLILATLNMSEIKKWHRLTEKHGIVKPMIIIDVIIIAICIILFNIFW